MMTRCPLPFVGAIALALAAPVATQVREREAMFVLRHDPSLLRLHTDMLNTLLDGELRSVQQRLYPELGQEDPLCFEATVVPATDDSGGQQPPGVYVGRLRVTLRSEVRRADESLVDFLLKSLEVALYRRISPSAQLESRVRDLERSIKDTRSELRDIYGMPDLENRSLQQLEEQHQRLSAQIAELEIEQQTDEPMLEHVSEMLAQTTRDLTAAEAARLAAERDLATLQGQAEQLTGSGAELEKNVEAWSARVRDAEVTHETSRLAALRAAERAQRLAQQLDETTMRVSRQRLRRKALERRLHEVALALEQARELAPTRREHAVRAQHLESELDRQQKQLQDLRTTLATLQPLTISKW